MTDPKVRFKDKNGKNYQEWETKRVDEIFYFITEKNKDRTIDNVITNSAEFGLILQKDFFNKDIALKDNTDGYTVIQQGDFVYNPRKSTTAPYGPFNCYQLEEKGIVSPLYTCLRRKMNGFSADYLKWYFASSAWHRYVYNNGAQGGVRHDRVGMTNNLMKGIPVAIPSAEEQQKIASCFSDIDEVIQKSEAEVAALEKHRKGVVQKIFSREVRFKDENGEDYPEWEAYKFSELASLSKEKYSPSTGIRFKCIELEHMDQVAGTINGYVNSDEQSSIKSKFYQGDVLFGKLRPYLRKYHKPNFDGVCSSEIWVLKPSILVTTEYLYCIVSSDEFIALTNVTSGTKMPRADWTLVSETTFDIPSVDEQVKISKCIEGKLTDTENMEVS